MKIHLIAIGGSIMHNLAIALHLKGYEVSGSDDQIYEPARSRLLKYGLLPKEGWDESKITPDIDSVILGMHAKEDNPELKMALDLGLKIYSFPEFVAEQSKNKIRVVVAGSHGKTSTTSMIMHALKKNNFEFDYLVGAIIDGFDVMVKLSDAPIIVIEGDEYLSSKLDMRPKFFHYKPNISAITGVAWDHINTFPTKSGYNEQFEKFVESHPLDATIYYFSEDKVLREISNKTNHKMIPYTGYEYEVSEEGTCVSLENKDYVLPVFGAHNMQNLQVAGNICKQLGVEEALFLNAMKSFTGASKRLELLVDKPGFKLYKDFAHAPSKARATIKAVKEKYEGWEITAILELHTFSSLNKSFLPEYKDIFEGVDNSVVCFSPKTVEQKGMEPIFEKDVLLAFGEESLSVVNEVESLSSFLDTLNRERQVVLFMSSGNFLGFDLDRYSKKILA